MIIMTEKEYCNFYNSEEDLTFGHRIRIWRILDNLTQERFTETLHLKSRTTIWKVESANSADDLNEEILFRIFFFFSETRDRVSDGYYKYFVNEILTEIRNSINNRIMTQEEKFFQKTKKHE